jgi:hypothetical protein
MGTDKASNRDRIDRDGLAERIAREHERAGYAARYARTLRRGRVRATLRVRRPTILDTLERMGDFR